MTVLEPGTFKVSDYRKAIPEWVKIVAVVRLVTEDETLLNGMESIKEWVRSLRFDHRPPLQDRPYDTEKGDFDPPQNDPDYIEAIPVKQHDERTFGRKADAEKTVTTANSDAGRRKHIRDVRNTEAHHQLKMAMKRGDPQAISRILGTVKQSRPKSKIPSRPFPKRQRSLSRRRA